MQTRWKASQCTHFIHTSGQLKNQEHQMGPKVYLHCRTDTSTEIISADTNTKYLWKDEQSKEIFSIGYSSSTRQNLYVLRTNNEWLQSLVPYLKTTTLLSKDKNLYRRKIGYQLFFLICLNTWIYLCCFCSLLSQFRRSSTSLLVTML